MTMSNKPIDKEAKVFPEEAFILFLKYIKYAQYFS